MCSRRFGDVDAQKRGSAVAFRPNGNLSVTGTSAGTIDFGGGALLSQGGTSAGDVFVLELDPDCGHVQSARYGDGDDQEGHAIADRRGGQRGSSRGTSTERSAWEG